MQQRFYKTAVMVAHDLAATAPPWCSPSCSASTGGMLAERLHALPVLLPPFLIVAGLVYGRFRLYRTKWRFASLQDLAGIVRAASVLALALLVTDYVLVSSDLYGFYFFGKIAILLYWVLQIFFLGGARLAFRYLKDTRSRQSSARAATVPTLLLGRGADIDVLIRAIEAGSVKKLAPRGILSPRADERGQFMRGVPVLGGFPDLERVVGRSRRPRRAGAAAGGDPERPRAGGCARRPHRPRPPPRPAARPRGRPRRGLRRGRSWRRSRSRTCCCARPSRSTGSGWRRSSPAAGWWSRAAAARSAPRSACGPWPSGPPRCWWSKAPSRRSTAS